MATHMKEIELKTLPVSWLLTRRTEVALEYISDLIEEVKTS